MLVATDAISERLTIGGCNDFSQGEGVEAPVHGPLNQGVDEMSGNEISFS